ncbi:putative FYVE zinc finger, peptidase C19, ubiquitin-specific peptidase, DUSP [Plasmopara halstedii]
MLDNKERSRRASQPFIRVVSSNHTPLIRSSSFLLNGFKAWRPNTKQTTSEATRAEERRGSNTNSTRRISGNLTDDDNVLEVLSIPTQENVREEEISQSECSRKTSLHLWKRLIPQPKNDVSQVAVMYSISFYPWKMEPHCYYSHPEAAANWVPDTASSRCQICLISFTLTRRRHHCRLCGHLVCANCSHDRTYLPLAGSAPSQHRLIKDGAPQRTCGACASTLRNMAAQDDPRVKRFTVAISSKGRQEATESSTSPVEVEIECPSLWMRRTGLGLTDYDIEDEEFCIESTKSLQLEKSLNGSALHFPLRLSVTRAEELDEVLNARACSQLKSALDQDEQSSSRHFVMSSAWLNQWLQYVRVISTDAEVHPPRIGPETRQSKKYRLARPPRPGPVTNYALLDFVNGELVPKRTLRRSRASHKKGDYHVVSQEVWLTFLTIYGGGPSIQAPIQESIDYLTPNAYSGRSSSRPRWIITEQDDSVPALASSKNESRSESTFYQTEPKPIHSCSGRSIDRSASASCLLSADSTPIGAKHLTSQCFNNDESLRSSASSHWKLKKENSRTPSKYEGAFQGATIVRTTSPLV